MPISIAGKKVIITGGGRGIGECTVRHFAREGAHVVIFDVQDASRVAAEASAEGPGKVGFRKVNVADEADVRTNVDAAVAELGGLDGIVNIAGITQTIDPEDNDEAGWDRLLAINVKGVAHMCQSAFPHLKRNGGSIVNFGSDNALSTVPPTTSAYAATKGAVMSYTRLLASAWGQYGIRANVLNPLMATPMYDEFVASMNDEQRAAFASHLRTTVPLGGRMGDSATEMAPVVAFFISDASKFITAQILGVNGGLNPGR
ncbi:SDR family NAD(P)-dependent oxidoreductase [Flavisphingomonas formosensis]|uniref:SDR family NAD(P)-dependent oxidoreductase n=1 Tax=Flavisphingomonas formosensis TaxID=861534 RepID=UPI0012F8DB95|nr:SDR family oxidoreductase [Sphingomonas formosensis]